MTRRYVNQLANGDSVDDAFLVADKQLRANRQGNLYLHLELRDKTGTVGARLWNATENLARQFEPGDYLHVRGKTQVFQGSLQIILTNLEVLPANQIEPEEFLPQSSQNVTKLLARLREVLLAMGNPHLRALVECFLIDDVFVRKFTTAPAGIKNHHAYQGGLIEHVVSLLNVADRISDLYPEIDRDIALDGDFPPRHRQGRRAVVRSSLRLHRSRAAGGAPGDGRRDAWREGRAAARAHGRSVPCRAALAAQAHDREPPWHARVWQSQAADDAGSDRAALSRQPRRQDPHLQP